MILSILATLALLSGDPRLQGLTISVAPLKDGPVLARTPLPLEMKIGV